MAYQDLVDAVNNLSSSNIMLQNTVLDVRTQVAQTGQEAIATAEAAGDRAEDAVARANAAADVVQLSSGVYANTTLGLAATAVDRYFSVPSSALSEYLILYKNTAGVAVEIKRYPSTKGVEDLGIEEQSTAVSGLAFAVVDDAGRRTWLEAGMDGAPSDHAANKIGGVLSIENTPVLSEALVQQAVGEALEGVGMEILSNVNDQSFAITDEDGRRLWLEAGKDGKPTQYAIDCIVGKLPGGIGEAPYTYQAGVKGTLGIVSGPHITCWGDSMTAGAGGSGTTYPGVLQSLLTAAGYDGIVTNRGVGGENTVTICARAGGNPFIALPVGGVIPATSTAFEITLQPINGLVPKPLMQGSSSYTGRLGNVPGTFSRTFIDTVYTYYFTRTVAGTQIVANRPLPLYLDIGDQGRDDINLIWIGQNGPTTARAIQDAKAIIQRMTALDKRFLVISMPGGTTAQDVDDALWFAEFGRRFIPIRQYMVKYGLADVGITPTAQDFIDMGNGTVPVSLRYDGVHWLGSGYTILANIIFQLLKEMEWI